MTLILNGTTGVSGVDGSAATPAFQGNDANTGISFGTDIVTINTGGQARVTTDASGNVGIGTVSPNVGLTVNSKSISVGNVVPTADIAFPSAYLNGFFRAVGNYQVGSGVGGTIQLGGKSYTDSGINAAFLISAISSSSATDALTFSTQTSFDNVVSERMRIDSSGNLLVGQTSWSFASNGTQIAANGRIYNTSNTDYNLELAGSTSARIRFYTSAGGSGTTVGSITVSGSATTYATSSDYRLKENVAPMTGALAKVAALKPVTYTWKSTGEDGQGFIAHELQEVVPDCVTGTKDAVDKDGNPQYQGVDTSFLVATLVAAIQELKNEVDALKGAQNV